MIVLKHPSKNDVRTYNWPEILKDVSTLEQFETNLKEDCKRYLTTVSPSRLAEENKKYLGNAFEVFAEFLLLKADASEITGIANYKPLDVSEGDKDIGVDGAGVGNDNKAATVQVKFRSNTSVELYAKEDGLSGFIAASQNQYGVDITAKYNMLVVTNCKGINEKSREVMLFNKVRCIGQSQIAKMVDSIIPWWDEFRSATFPINTNKGRRLLPSLV